MAGFLVSGFVAFFLLYSGQDTLTSVILGFVLAIFVQLLDIQRRILDSEDRLARAIGLSKKLHKDEWLYSHIEGIVRDYQQVESSWYEVFRLRAKDMIIECHNEIHALAEGHMIVGGRSPYGFGVSGIRLTEKSLKAVSLSGNEFWSSVWGENYLQTNETAIRSGVKIVRIFMNSPAELKELATTIKKHQDIGIEVYVVSTEQAHKELHQDFIIMDERLINLTEYSGTGKIKQWRQSTDIVEIAQTISKFDTIMRMARKPELT